MSRRKGRRKKRVRFKKSFYALVAGVVLVFSLAICLLFRGPSGEKKEVPVEDIDYSKAVIETEETEEQDPMVDDTVYSAAENAETHGYAADGEVKSDHAVLVNLNEGTIIAKKGSIHERIYPASMTKIMTILVAAEHLESRESLNDKVTINIGDTDYSYTNDCSAVGFSVDEVVTVNDLFCAGICSSGADAMMALAEYVAGSQEQFVMLMNEKVKKMELDGTHFTNCVGVFHSENYSTLYDMAMIMEAAENNEICRSALACKKYTTSFTEQHPEGIETSNWFLRRIEDKENGQMVMGAKTGFVSESGNCAASYAENQAGEKYICVTAGAWSSWRCIYDHVEIYREVL